MPQTGPVDCYGLLFPTPLPPMQSEEPHLGGGSRVGCTCAEAIGGRPAEPDLVADTWNARSPRDPHGNIHEAPDMLGAVRVRAVFVLPGTPAGHHLDVHFVGAPAGAGLERGDIAFQLAELGPGGAGHRGEEGNHSDEERQATPHWPAMLARAVVAKRWRR